MTDDIVTRLRDRAGTWLDHCCDDAELDRDVADEIERLRAENTILRQAAGEEGRANRMTLLYESAQSEIERLLMEASYGWG